MDHALRIEQIRGAEDRTGQNRGLVQDVAVSLDHDAALQEDSQGLGFHDVKVAGRGDVGEDFGVCSVIESNA